MKFKHCLMAGFLLTSQACLASLSVKPLKLSFDKKQKMNNISITNNSDHVEYLNAKLFNGSVKDGKYTYTLMDKKTQKVPMRITPSRMAIQPHATKQIRVRMKDFPKHADHLYRLDIEPISGDFLVKNPGKHKKNGDRGFGMKILIGYEIRLIAKTDAQPDYTMTLERNGKQLTAHNLGNKALELRSGMQCENPEDEKTCTRTVPLMRLYPGAIRKIELKKDLPISFTYTSTQGSESVSSN